MGKKITKKTFRCSEVSGYLLLIWISWCYMCIRNVHGSNEEGAADREVNEKKLLVQFFS